MIAKETFYFMMIALLTYNHNKILELSEDYPRLSTFVEEFDEVMDEYDFIIVGAGSAGCVVASGLSQAQRHSILLIEAGGHQILESKIPMLMNEAASSGSAWHFRSSRQENACLANGGECLMPRGKMMGGTSSVNSMIYLRGNLKDFDGWSPEVRGTGEWFSPGFSQWGRSIMFRHLFDQEQATGRELTGSLNLLKFHNPIGSLMVRQNNFKTPLASAYLEAGKQLGFDVTDLNGGKRTGFMYFQGTMTDKGRRVSSNSAFRAFSLYTSTTRNTIVSKILFEGNRAYGVIAEKDGKKKILRAKKEILLCAGTIASPQLLMLSGIGPKEVLAPLGIPIVADLPVGKNLQDHLEVGLNFKIKEGISLNKDRVYSNEAIYEYAYLGSGPLSSPVGIEALAYVNSTQHERENDYPDIELIMSSFGIDNAWRVSGFQLRPKSVGELKIRSTNLNDHPIINPNYLAVPEDLEKMIQVVKYCVALSETPAMAQFGSKIIKPPNCQQPIHSREFAECMVRQYSASVHDQVGTCRMHKEGVVDFALKVHGIEGLRVIDASIMPSIPSSNINAIVMAIAGRAVEIILREIR